MYFHQNLWRSKIQGGKMMNENDATKLITDAYVYGYPIVGMYELLYQQVLGPNKTTKMNEFLHTAVVSTPKTAFIPAPNNDTTYSRAWLDLRKEPVIIETPDTDGRYYSIQLTDMFTDITDNLGKRLYGTKKHVFAIVGPTWNGDLPNGVIPIDCKTTLALAFLRVLIKGENDLDTVKDLQRNFVIKSLSEYVTGQASDDRENLNLPDYITKTYYEFFNTLNHVLALTPKLEQDKEFLRKIKEIGIGPEGKIERLKEIPEKIIKDACEGAIEMIDQGGMHFGEEVNHWRIARKNIGIYGNDYMQRSVVWFKGALANTPEESLYPSTFKDSHGNLLSGEHNYRIHFDKNQLPPVSQFWSLTMYRFSDAFLIENKIDRYSIGDRTKDLYYDSHGGLTIYIQHQEPEDEKEKLNWLPSPNEAFYMTLRLYGPSKEAIQGKWIPPIVEKD